MNALADKVHKQEVPCTQLHSLHNMATLFNNHPYKSSSDMSVGTNLLLLMKGWLLNNVTVVWNAYNCAHGTSCSVADLEN